MIIPLHLLWKRPGQIDEIPPLGLCLEVAIKGYETTSMALDLSTEVNVRIIPPLLSQTSVGVFFFIRVVG